VIAFWPHTSSELVSSYRVRCLRVQQRLTDLGLKVVFYDGKSVPDVLVLSKRYDSYSCAVARQLKSKGTKIVLDICDNYFFSEKEGVKESQRANDLRIACALADEIVTTSVYLKGVIEKEVALNVKVTIIDDFIECFEEKSTLFSLRKFENKRHFSNYRKQIDLYGGDCIRLVWFGNHGSPGVSGGMDDIYRIIESLNSISKRKKLVLTVISNNKKKFDLLKGDCKFPVLYLEWNLTTITSALSLQGVSLIPIGLNPFTLAKSNTRVMTSLSLGLPVLADRLPSYEEFKSGVVLGDLSVDFEALLDQVINSRVDFDVFKRNIDTISSWNEVLSGTEK
jgi:hypothetical protein